METIASLSIISVVAVLAPLLARGVGRLVAIPVVVFELLLGILVGPSLLGWAQPGELLDVLSEFGLAVLFFVAGTEIEAATLRGRTGRRAWLGWLISIAVGVAIGWVLLPGDAAIIIGVALASTALGTLLPMLRDAGELRSDFGSAVSALGTVGEFGPLIAISLFLGGRRLGAATVVLVLFALLAAVAVWWAARAPQGRLHAIVASTLHTSSQFAVRAVLLILVALVALSVALDLDMLLGAFLAGVLWPLLMREAAPADRHVVDSKIEGLAFGFLVPLFFVYTGVTFDLEALRADPVLFALVPIALIALLVVRGMPSLLAAPPGSGARERIAVGLMGATGLPIIVAVTAIGVDQSYIDPAVASVLVAAGMLSVLLFPVIALGLRGDSIRRAAAREQSLEAR